MWGLKGYSIMTYESDTLIQNQLCQKITNEYHGFMWDSPDVWFATPVSKNVAAYTYVVGDTVFYLAPDGEFRVLLNFAAQIGDTWDISYYDDGDSTTQDTSRVVVVDDGWSSGNRYIVIEMATCSHDFFEGIFDERFGFIYHGNYSPAGPFPSQNWGCIDDNTYCGNSRNLCSYSDARGQQYGVSGENCEFPGINVLEVNEFDHSAFNTFPNPVDNVFIISGISQEFFELSLIDIAGKVVVKRKVISNGEQIDVSELKSGVYIVQIEVNGLTSTQKLMIK
jgi:hypothetical protein